MAMSKDQFEAALKAQGGVLYGLPVAQPSSAKDLLQAITNEDFLAQHNKASTKDVWVQGTTQGWTYWLFGISTNLNTNVKKTGTSSFISSILKPFGLKLVGEQ